MTVNRGTFLPPVVTGLGTGSQHGELKVLSDQYYFWDAGTSTWIGLGFRILPVNSQTGNYTTVLADVGKTVRHPSGGGASDTFTINSEANVPWPNGAAITFENRDSNNLSIAITTDTLRMASDGSTGTRTLAQYGIATAVFDSVINEWLISGVGLT